MPDINEARAAVIAVIEASAAAALQTAGQDGSNNLGTTLAHLRRARMAAETLALMDGHISALGSEKD